MNNAKSTATAVRHVSDSSVMRKTGPVGEGGDQEKEERDYQKQTAPGPASTSELPSPIDSPPGLSTSGSATSSEHLNEKRNFSGNILGRLNFLRNADGIAGEGTGDQNVFKSSDDRSGKSRKSVDDDTPSVSPTSPVKGENATVPALKVSQTRKRKGSLRKTALLGGRRLATEGRERRNSLLRSSSNKQPPQPIPRHAQPLLVSTHVHTSSSTIGDDQPLAMQRQPSYDSSPDSLDSGTNPWARPIATPLDRLSLMAGHTAQLSRTASSKDLLGSPLDVKAHLNNNSNYNSTTDEDDMLTFDRPANGSFVTPRAVVSLNKPLSSAATTYFPTNLDASLTRSRTSSKQRRSPLSHTVSSSSLEFKIEPHDYTETEYWGWVILFVTWLTFTVGMGSCLDIWSWAWDIGETPYAPPELEDDPTLPIVGYYPALIVLTGVVAWCWITVAWVGMKYFRHAKIEV
nr:uncharacterized protein CFP56_21925 [Quercus suber]